MYVCIYILYIYVYINIEHNTYVCMYVYVYVNIIYIFIYPSHLGNILQIRRHSKRRSTRRAHFLVDKESEEVRSRTCAGFTASSFFRSSADVLLRLACQTRPPLHCSQRSLLLFTQVRSAKLRIDFCTIGFL